MQLHRRRVLLPLAQRAHHRPQSVGGRRSQCDVHAVITGHPAKRRTWFSGVRRVGVLGAGIRPALREQTVAGPAALATVSGSFTRVQRSCSPVSWNPAHPAPSV